MKSLPPKRLLLNQSELGPLNGGLLFGAPAMASGFLTPTPVIPMDAPQSSRRTFLKQAALAGLGTSLAGVSLANPAAAPTAAGSKPRRSATRC